MARRRRSDQKYKNQTYIWKVIVWIKYTDISTSHTVHVKHLEINPTYCSCQTYRNQSTNHIFWEFDAWQVLDVFMLSVDDLRQLPAINHLFVHVHLNFWVESFLPLHHIFSKNFGNRRPPDKKKFPLTECFNLCEAFDRKYIYLSNFSLEYVYHHLICFTSQKNNNSCWCFNL